MASFVATKIQKIQTMESIKQRQMSEMIKRHFSIVLQNEGRMIYGARILVSITDVKMSPDMGIAKIYLSVFNTENKQEPILELETEMVRLRQVLAARIRHQVRRIPLLQLYLDDTIDEIFKIESMFEKLHADNQMGQGDTKPAKDENEDEE
jgi:ribosome-binding factor A